MPTTEQINTAINHGHQLLGERDILEETVKSPLVDSPSFRHQKSTGATKEARSVAKRGFVEVSATQMIAKEFLRTSQQSQKSRWSIGKGSKLTVGEEKSRSMCTAVDPRYRTANGTCNSKLHPEEYGVAMRPFRRHLNPDYADGINLPRRSVNGAELPSARAVSLGVHRPSYQSDPNFTVMLAVWGQFLDHDITATAAVQGQDGQPIECCGATAETKHPECFEVPLGTGDPYFDRDNLTCMNFVRSAAASTGHLGPRQQLNQATAFIDGSVVYGSSDERIDMLRSQQDGLLRMFNTPDNRTLLPVSTDPKDGCNELEQNLKGRYCFESGDARANENLHLTSMHLIWARQHNSLAQGLQKVNPQWDDERLFQEARKILGAQMAQIQYNEFLPMLLGTEYSQHTGISSNVTSEEDTYDPAVNPSIANGFAAFAFRFAHTLLPSLFRMTSNQSDPAGLELHKLLFNPYSLWENKGVDEAVRSAMNTQLGRTDPFFTTELTEKLFASRRQKSRKPGLDLVSLNIQRGRDHGLPTYPAWREHCGFPAIRQWRDMQGVVDDGSLQRMQQIYKEPADVDAYTGALSEPPEGDAILGPLLQCLITDQFVRMKKGDAFWYERTEGGQRFTRRQLQQIRGTTLAAVLCRNSDDVSESPEFVMRTVSATNPMRSCAALDTFDFGPWSESGAPAVMRLVQLPQSGVQVKALKDVQVENARKSATSTESVTAADVMGESGN